MTSRAPSPPHRMPRSDREPPIRRIVALLARQAAREWIAACASGTAPASRTTNERPPSHGKS
jgi:hypothetical protein